MGFSAGTYPSVSQSTNYSILSTSTPQVTPVQSIIVTCSVISSKYSIPSNVIHSFSPNVTYGSLIKDTPSQPIMNDIADGRYNSLTVQFLDQSFNRVTIQDSNIVVLLVIE